MRTAIVTGAEGSLGQLIVQHLTNVGYYVVPLVKENCDLRRSDDIIEFADKAIQRFRRYDVLVNCAGLCSINWLADLDETEWDDVYAVNVKGPYLLAQSLLPALDGGTILNITSRAARVPMRCSLAYNSSKAAAEMLTRQLARELYTTNGITVFGIAPNKLAGTAMSQQVDAKVCEVRGWTAEEARQYELAAMVVKEETPPEAVAELIGFLLSSKSRHKHLNGCIINYGD